MNNSNYETLNNDRGESSGDEGDFTIRRKDKSSLRIRLKRVFSAGSSVISPGPRSSPSDSQSSSPARSSSSSPAVKFRYSWQTTGKPENRSLQPSPQRSPKFGTPRTPTKLLLSPPSSDSASSPASPAIPQHLLYASIWYDEMIRMKYSPQQQQKERKSESESINATPSRDLENRTRSSTAGDAGHEDQPASSTASRFSICRRGSSTGMFAWMRVFRLATMLHQVGC